MKAQAILVALLVGTSASAQEYAMRDEAVTAVYEAAKSGLPYKLEGMSVYRSVARLRFLKDTHREIVVDVIPPALAKEALCKDRGFALDSPSRKDVPEDFLCLLRKRLVDAENARAKGETNGASQSFWFIRKPSRLARPVHPLNRPKVTVPSSSRLSEAQSLAGEGKCSQALELIKTGGDNLDIAGLRVVAQVKRVCGVEGLGLNEILSALKGVDPNDPMWLDVALETLESAVLAGNKSETKRLSELLFASLPYLFEQKECVVVEAMNLALEEALVKETKEAFEAWKDAKEARCKMLFALKLATAKDEDEQVDRAGEAVLSRFPNDEDALFLWGSYYYAKGAKKTSVEKALKVWDILADVDPFYPTFIGQYGTLCLVSERLRGEKALEFKELADAHPSDALAQYLAGLGLYYAREYQKAREYLGKAQKRFSGEPRVKMYYAMSLFFSGEREESLKLLESLSAFAYQEPDIYYCRSLVYRFFDLKKAIKEMERFIEVFEGEKRLRFGEQKVEKAKKDLERMRRGEVPEVELPTPDPIR
jgi:tetratricopeptide (TPR) repeat protein